MNTKILLLFGFLLLISCSDDMLITSISVGKFKLGNLHNDKDDIEGLDITVDSKNLIKTIIVNSPKYKTKEGFGIGTNINEIENKTKSSAVYNDNFEVSKGNNPIINLGRNIVYNEIIFLDENKDDIIDYVIIHKDY